MSSRTNIFVTILPHHDIVLLSSQRLAADSRFEIHQYVLRGAHLVSSGDSRHMNVDKRCGRRSATPDIGTDT